MSLIDYNFNGTELSEHTIEATGAEQRMSHDNMFDVVIRTASSGGGTLLVADTDYVLSDYNVRYRGYNRITFAAGYTGQTLYVYTSKTRGDFFNSYNVNKAIEEGSDEMVANSIKGNPTASTASPADIALSANKFLARASAGNLEAKSITDFGLGLVATADAAAGRTALGAAPTESPAFTGKPVISNIYKEYGTGARQTSRIFGGYVTTATGTLRINLPFSFGLATMGFRIFGLKYYNTTTVSLQDIFSIDAFFMPYSTGNSFRSKCALVHSFGAGIPRNSDNIRIAYDTNNNNNLVILIGNTSTVWYSSSIYVTDMFNAALDLGGISITTTADEAGLGGITTLNPVFSAPTDSPTFTGQVTLPVIKPPSDSTTALQLTKANGTTPVLVADTTNSQIGVGKTPTESFDVSGNIKGSGYVELNEMSAPAAGAADTGRLFLRDNGSGKTQLCVIFNAGDIQVIATQP